MSTILGTGVKPEEALKYWESKISVPDYVAKEMAENAKARAFYVTGLAQRDQVELVRKAIGEALENGETFTSFRDRINEIIGNGGWHDHRIENIFRTNMQTAYSVGRYSEQTRLKDVFPYWQYVAIEDKRTRPSHVVLNGLVYPADHEFWNTNYPPNGFRCRCGVQSLTAKQVERKGLPIEKEMPKAMMYTDPKTKMEYHVAFPGADPGFRNNAGKDWMSGIDLKKYPDLNEKSYLEERNISPLRTVATHEELAAQIREFASPFCRNGKVDAILFKADTSFMATNSRGIFLISTKEFPRANNFAPARDLKNAWNKIAKKEKLTFNEEYAIESLWHEIVHNRQKPTPAGGQDSLARRMMEVVTQWTARRTYPQFLKSLGGEAIHQKEILKNGYGYGQSINIFDQVRETLGVKDDAKMVQFFEEVMRTEERSKYKKHIAEYFSKNSENSLSKSQINQILKDVFTY